jgi:hypothetical protein
MKTNIFPVIAYLAAIAAFVFMPVSPVAACIALSVIGTISVLAADYARAPEPVRVPAPVVPCAVPRLAFAGSRVAA